MRVAIAEAGTLGFFDSILNYQFECLNFHLAHKTELKISFFYESIRQNIGGIRKDCPKQCNFVRSSHKNGLSRCVRLL